MGYLRVIEPKLTFKVWADLYKEELNMHDFH